MVEKMLSRSVRLMFIGGVAMGAGILAQPAFAQDTAPQRIEITGSSIKRIAKEGALPVQTLSRKDIEQSGVTNVADLVAALPAMQGFITSSASVNGGGSGVQTASIHAIGTAYTLVLLNGRRMAPYGTGSAVNLASIPLSAVERVEILTDGASTLYGSDAIAGVINFILKKNQQDFVVEATLNSPQESGGRSTNFSISKGFGDLTTDGYNLQVSYAHDEQDALKATQRDFAKSGVKRFNEGGEKYAIFQTSINSIPAVFDSDLDAFSPDFIKTGKCNGPNTFQRGEFCRYDYAATVDLIPKTTRDSIFANGSWKLSSETTLFGEAVLSKFTNRAQYAAPAQPLTIFSTDPITKVKTVNQNYIGAYNTTVVPMLTARGVKASELTDAFFYFRAYDAGGRADEYKTDANHLVLGMDSNIAGWDYKASYTHSENTQTDQAVSGYMSSNKFNALVKSGAFNPFIMNPNASAILAPAVLNQNLLTTKSKIDVLSANTSKEMFSMAGGAASLGMGIDFTKQSYQDQYSSISKGPGPQNPDKSWTDTQIGGGTGAQDLDATRQSWGAFGEMLMPVIKNLDVTAAVRYDSYDAVKKNNTTYNTDGSAAAAGEVGNAVSKATYKLSARFQPTETVLLRASYGTGFKAPTMNNIADPVKNAGSSSFFPCPITNPTDYRFPYCRGAQEYGLLTKGNANKGSTGLKAEESNQMAFGIRFEPMKSLTVGFDWWDVKLKNQIQSLSQDQIYTTPALADKYIQLYFDPIQGSKVIVAQLSPVNLATSHYQGIDWDSTYRTATPLGALSVNWSGTYMLKAEQDVPGVGLEKSVGRFDSSDNVVFKVISRMVFSLKSSDMISNSLTMNYRSGYRDKVINASDSQLRFVNEDGSIGGLAGLERSVKKYLTLDWQIKANASKNLTLTAGVRNLLNQDPPLSIRNTGGGNQVGYDGRYTDPLGRTVYMTGNIKF
ncbi:TonB-dependent receptor domain-containing protein [Undibacterium seohonense]|nr:TonB-dependent receptor [Undibacterium seohonense]